MAKVVLQLQALDSYGIVDMNIFNISWIDLTGIIKVNQNGNPRLGNFIWNEVLYMIFN